MSIRTKWNEIKKDPLHLVFVLLYAIGFGLLINVLRQVLGIYHFRGGMGVVIDIPFVVAGGMRIAEGLERFSGKGISSGWTSGHTYILISILFSYVISLPLFAWGMRERTFWRQGSGERRFPTRIVLVLAFSGSFVLGACVVATFPPFMAFEVRKTLEHAQTIQSNKDALINDMNYVALRAQSFYYVDVKDGGGGGRWKDIQREGSPVLGIEELVPAGPVVANLTKNLFPQQPSRFLVHVQSEDSLTVWGIGKEEGEDETFRNEDGRKGRLQMKMIVTPKRIYVNSEN